MGEDSEPLESAAKVGATGGDWGTTVLIWASRECSCFKLFSLEASMLSAWVDRKRRSGFGFWARTRRPATVSAGGEEGHWQQLRAYRDGQLCSALSCWRGSGGLMRS